MSKYLIIVELLHVRMSCYAVGWKGHSPEKVCRSYRLHNHHCKSLSLDRVLAVCTMYLLLIDVYLPFAVHFESMLFIRIPLVMGRG